MGPTDPRGCRLIGLMGEGQVVQPNSQIMFRIQAGDAFANHKLHGGDHYVVKLDGPHPVAGVVKDMHDGTYNASFTVSKAGTYSVFVGISYLEKYEVSIYGSPFTITVPKIPCPPCQNKGPDDAPCVQCTSPLHGECQDNGVCKCKG